MESDSSSRTSNSKTPLTTTDSFSDKEIVQSIAEAYNTIITDELMKQFNIYVSITLCGSIAVSGTISNFISMVIFFSLGVKDSMSVCLFVLSLNDALLALLIAMSRALFIWNIFYTGEGIDPVAVSYVGTGWVLDSLFLCSGWILTFLSLERCVCVIFPFKVKQIFTKTRSIVAIIVIYLLIASTYVPIYATQWLGWTDIEMETENASITTVTRRLIVMFSDNRQRIESSVAIFNSTVIPVPSLVIIFGSVLWMTYGLVASSKLRHSMTSSRKTETDGEKQDPGSKLTRKTRRLVMVVLCLAIIFIVCSIPRTIGKSIKVIFPEVNEGGRERNLNQFIWQFARLAASINASINIVVYLTINTSYRERFYKLMPCLKA